MNRRLWRCTSWSSSFSKGLLSALLLGVLTIRSANAGAGDEEGEPLLLRHPNVTVAYYPVEGLSEEDLVRELRRAGPVDGGGVRREAFFSWRLRWRWPNAPSGPPELHRATVSFDGIALLPKWENEPQASEALRRKWRRYFQSVVRHEEGHLELALDEAARLQNLLTERAKSGFLTTQEANALGDEAVRRLRKRDIAFDRVTDHGRSTGARFPDG